MVECWNCGKNLEIVGSVGFRAICEHCQVNLHCCRGCRFYAPGHRNDCLVPDTEPITDRLANNFCDEFMVTRPKGSRSKDSQGDAFRKLFKEEPPPKRSFDDLF